jgi:Uma2 family endonuclease
MSILALDLPRAGKARPLENGERLEANEFLRRYDAMPNLKKAELIQGIVYMGSPVRAAQHGMPDALIQAWLGLYTTYSPGVDHALNSTVILSDEDVPQPDGLLVIRPEYGGQSRLDEEGYIVGAPELAVEVAASTSSIDAHKKRESYEACGAREYLLWRTVDQEVDWWVLAGGKYKALPIGQDGILRSQAFPGLWLDRAALLERQRAKLMSCLHQGIQSAEHNAFVAALAQTRSREAL